MAKRKADEAVDPTVDTPVQESTQATPEQQAAAPAEPAQHRKTFGFYSNAKQGIRIEKELDRKPGQTKPRVLIKFDEDKKPSEQERAVIKQEGFRWDADDKAWTMPLTAAGLVLAQEAVSQVLKMRGDEQGLYIDR